MSTPETSLAELERADLIRRLIELDEAYQFKHNLIQESAYASLLRNDRRTLHRAAAEALERAYANELDANAALLAKHYAEAGDEEKTYVYARRAGDAAYKLSAYAEALMQYDTAALLAPRLPVSPRDFVALHQIRGRTLELMARYDEAIEEYRALYAIGQKRRNTEITVGALLSLATLQIFPNQLQNLPAALTANQEALALARESGDAACQARALWNMVLYSYFSGHIREAIRFGNEGLAIADQNGLRELRAYILNDMSRALISASGVHDALQALAQARTIWIETQNLPMLADNLASTSEMSFISGDHAAFDKFYQETVTLCREIGNLWNLTYVEGVRLQMEATRGNFDTFVTGAAQVKALSRLSGFVVSESIVNVLEATMMGELGMPERGLAYLEQQANAHPFYLMDSWRFGMQAYLATMLGEPDRARQDLEHARAGLAPEDISNYGPIYIALCSAELSLALGNDADAVQETAQVIPRLYAANVRYLLPELLLLHARGLFGSQEWDAAEQDLREAEAIALSMQDRLGLWQIYAYRAKLESVRGNPEGAITARGQAREIMEWIADHSPHEYRAPFFARPLAQYVLGAD